MTSADAEDLFRNAWIARQAVRSAAHRYGDQAPHAEWYVRAALLGSDIGKDVNLFSHAETFRDIPFRAGKFAFSFAGGFTFADVEIAALGERLIGDDLLPLQHFVWSGVNTGPV